MKKMHAPLRKTSIPLGVKRKQLYDKQIIQHKRELPKCSGASDRSGEISQREWHLSWTLKAGWDVEWQIERQVRAILGGRSGETTGAERRAGQDVLGGEPGRARWGQSVEISDSEHPSDSERRGLGEGSCT